MSPTSSPIPCFFLEPTDRQRLSLRRYRGHGKPDRACPLMPGEYSYHDAKVAFAEAPAVQNAHGGFETPYELQPPTSHKAWPARCACGYDFQPDDEWQLFAERLYRRLDTGQIVTLRDAPAGALWYAPWRETEGSPLGPDGHVLYCRTPGGDWCIDERASNCDMPGDTRHRCWVRHGDPTDPLGLRTGQPLHADKRGLTCRAGAGSIALPRYHGFLHGGRLVEC